MSDLHFTLRAHPFSANGGLVHAREGQTIAQMLRAAAGGRELAPLEVRIGGYEVPAKLWDRVRPKKGAVIEVTGLPEGGMNQNWRAVLMIVVAVVAWWAGGAAANAAWGSSIGMTQGTWAGVFMMASSLAIYAKVKVPGVTK